MTRWAPFGAIGLGGSALIHIGGAALLLYSTTAKPIPPQPTKTSKMLVQSQPAALTKARPVTATGETAAPMPAQGQTVAASGPRQSHAAPIPLPALPAAQADAAPKRLNPSTITGSAVPAIAAEEASLKAALPSENAVQAAPVAAVRIRAALLNGETLTNTFLHPDPSPPVATKSEALAALDASQPVVPALSPRGRPAPQIPAQGDAITAQLAFSGESGQTIDAQSLAAFHSFTRPQDPNAQAKSVRDGIGQVLAQVPCARLQVAFDPNSAQLTVNGHVPDNNLRAPVLAMLGQHMGSDIVVADNIKLLPRPQCETLTGIEAVGLPQSTDQVTNPLLVGADTHVREFTFRPGDLLFLDLVAPDYPAYVYVDFYDAAGNVLHLSPNDHAPLVKHAAKTPFAIGSEPDDINGLKLEIAPPYGQEIVAAYAASHPIYVGQRPLIEPASTYLQWLRSQVDATRSSHPDFKGEWVYFLLSTVP